MPSPALILLLHALATVGMAAVIWFIQLVHYPAYRDLGPAEFTAFQKHATVRTGFVVGPLMFTELITAGLLLWRPPAGISPGALWFGAALIALCWASTLLVQVPLHVRLTAQHHAATIDLLIRTNWLRTLAWTLRAVLVATWLATAVAPDHYPHP